jgi:hypothetical protein
MEQGILNEAWKHKLIFVETPDAAETSIALENYRRVSRYFNFDIRTVDALVRPVTMDVELYYCLLPEARCRKVSISITTTVEL